MRALSIGFAVAGFACSVPVMAESDSYYVCHSEMIDVEHAVTDVFIAPPGLTEALEADFRQYMYKLANPSDFRNFTCNGFASKSEALVAREQLFGRLERTGVPVRTKNLFGVWFRRESDGGLRRYAGEAAKRTAAADTSTSSGATASRSNAEKLGEASSPAAPAQDGELVFYLTTSIRPLSDPPTYNSMCVSNVIRRKAKGWPNQSHADALRIIKSYHVAFLAACRGMGGEVVDVNEPRPAWNASGRTLQEMKALHHEVAGHPQNIPVNGL